MLCKDCNVKVTAFRPGARPPTRCDACRKAHKAKRRREYDRMRGHTKSDRKANMPKVKKCIWPGCEQGVSVYALRCPEHAEIHHRENAAQANIRRRRREAEAETERRIGKHLSRAEFEERRCQPGGYAPVRNVELWSEMQ